MNQSQRYAFFSALKAKTPKPTTELNYTSPFELLVAVMLSAQATDVSVNKATNKLYRIANTPQSILDLGVDSLKQYIKTIGLFNTKANNIIKTCRQLLDKHNGEVPNNRDALQALPGVGRKTANVILNTAFNQPVIAVDTHLFRLSNRTGLARGKTVDAVENKLMQVVPDAFLQDAHHWLILHGRYVCTARNPHCNICVVTAYCDTFRQQQRLQTGTV